MGGKCDNKEGDFSREYLFHGDIRDIREGVTLRKVILWRLGYNPSLCIFIVHLIVLLARVRN